MNSGATPSRSKPEYYTNGEIPWVKISDIENAKGGIIIDTEEKITLEGLKSINNRIFKPGTLLLAMYGSVGKVALLDKEMSTNQAILGIEIIEKGKLSSNYLKLWFTTIKESLLNRAVGGVLKNISLGIVKELEIPLPPLPIQEKIAEILDKADELRRKDKELQTKYDELAQAIFIDMFGDPVKNEKSWEVKRLEEFIDSIVDVGSNGANEWVSKNIQMKDVEDYAIMIRTTNLANNDFLKNLKYVGKETYELFKKTKVYGGEIIMNKIGSAGDFWSMPYLNRPVSLGLNQLMIKISNINQVFLLNQMSIESYKKLIKSKTQGAITKSITKGAVKALELIVPPIHLQEAFAKKIELINQLKAQTNTAKSEELFQSLLQKAFRGELVTK